MVFRILLLPKPVLAAIPFPLGTRIYWLEPIIATIVVKIIDARIVAAGVITLARRLLGMRRG